MRKHDKTFKEHNYQSTSLPPPAIKTDTPNQTIQVSKLIENNKGICGDSKKDLQQTNLVRHHINTGDSSPIRQPSYRKNIQEVASLFLYLYSIVVAHTICSVLIRQSFDKFNLTFETYIKALQETVAVIVKITIKRKSFALWKRKKKKIPTLFHSTTCWIN